MIGTALHLSEVCGSKAKTSVIGGQAWPDAIHPVANVHRFLSKSFTVISMHYGLAKSPMQSLLRPISEGIARARIAYRPLTASKDLFPPDRAEPTI